MRASFERVAHAGRLVYVGITSEDVPLPDPIFHRREMTLLASRNSLPSTFQRVLGLLEAGRIDVLSWVTHRIPLSRLPEEFSGYTRPETGVFKLIVEAGA
jgi:alcohol dehydrogenase